MAPWALFNGYRWSSPMSQHFRFDASRSLTALEQDSTIVAVIEMSQTKWLVAALVPGVERQPLKKFDAQEEMLLKLLHRWRREAGNAGRNIKRIVVALRLDGAEIVNGVADRMRREMYRNIGLEDLLHPAIIA
jgi:hypothetical protein